MAGITVPTLSFLDTVKAYKPRPPRQETAWRYNEQASDFDAAKSLLRTQLAKSSPGIGYTRLRSPHQSQQTSERTSFDSAFSRCLSTARSTAKRCSFTTIRCDSKNSCEGSKASLPPSHRYHQSSYLIGNIERVFVWLCLTKSYTSCHG